MGGGVRQYIVKQVVEFEWLVPAHSAYEAAQIALGKGWNDATTGFPNHLKNDLDVRPIDGAASHRFNSSDID